jgi:predicted MFS family arabinose efflux permease
MTTARVLSILTFLFAITFCVLVFTTEYSPARSNVLTAIAVFLIVCGSISWWSRWMKYRKRHASE